MPDTSPNEYVYMSTEAGHRPSWQRLFCEILGYEPLVGQPDPEMQRSLVSARNVLFGSLEDNFSLFAKIALLRALRGKRTAVIVVNPGRAIHGNRMTHKMKYLYLRFFKLFPLVRSLSIVPFYIDPRLKRLTDDWFYDGQFWDLTLEERQGATTALSEDILKQAEGRDVVLLLGRMDKSKGSSFFVECLRAHPELTETHLFVVAGKAAPDCTEAGKELISLGGLHVDRFLEDDEVVSLKHACTTLWACYDPYYNSSSGVFGRALQIGKDTLVRKGSYIDIIAKKLRFPVGTITYGDTAAVKAYLLKPSKDTISDYNPYVECREQALTALEKTLGPLQKGKLEELRRK